MTLSDTEIWYEVGDKLGLPRSVCDVLIARDHAQKTKQSGIPFDPSPGSAFTEFVKATIDRPEILIRLTAEYQSSMEDFKEKTKDQTSTAVLAAFFPNDNYVSNEIRQTLLTPTDSNIAIPRQFEFAILGASHAAKTLIDPGIYERHVIMSLWNRMAFRTDNDVFVDSYRDPDLLTLQSYDRIAKATTLLGSHLQSIHSGFSTLFACASTRAAFAFDAIVADAAAPYVKVTDKLRIPPPS